MCVNSGAEWRKLDQLDFSFQVLLTWTIIYTCVSEVPLSKALDPQLFLWIFSNADKIKRLNPEWDASRFTNMTHKKVLHIAFCYLNERPHFKWTFLLQRQRTVAACPSPSLLNDSEYPTTLANVQIQTVVWWEQKGKLAFVLSRKAADFTPLWLSISSLLRLR